MRQAAEAAHLHSQEQVECEKGLIHVGLESRVATARELGAPKVHLQSLDGTLDRRSLTYRPSEALSHRWVLRVDRRKVAEGNGDVASQVGVPTATLLSEWARRTRDSAFSVHGRAVEITFRGRASTEVWQLKAPKALEHPGGREGCHSLWEPVGSSLQGPRIRNRPDPERVLADFDLSNVLIVVGAIKDDFIDEAVYFGIDRKEALEMWYERSAVVGGTVCHCHRVERNATNG